MDKGISGDEVGPLADPTPDAEMNAGIDEAIRLGWIEEASPGRYSLTEAGKRRGEAHLLADRLTTLVDGIEGRNELRVGLRMCAEAMAAARDFLIRDDESQIPA